MNPNQADSIVTIEDMSDFQRLSSEWDALVRAMPRPSPFFVHGYLSTWWRHYGAGHELKVQAAYAGGRLVGALPVYVESRAGIRSLRFVGGVQSALGDVLLAPGADAGVASALAARVPTIEHDLVDVQGLPAHNRLGAAHPGELCLIERVEAPVLELKGDWPAIYRSKTSSKKRNLHKRRRRQLGEAGHLEVSVARTPDELERALEESLRLHRLRWEGRPDGSDFASDRGARFQHAAIQALAPLDMPRIVTLSLDGRAIAFHYYFLFCQRMYVHRLAFDPALARHSPGLVNTLDAIEAAADEGAQLVEFLGGAERYKRELADRFEPLYQGVGLARTVKGRALVRARIGMIEARKRLKRSPTARRMYFERLAPARKSLARIRGRASAIRHADRAAR